MKISDLEYFITVSQSASISEASEKLYVAQPSLTKAIHRLEEEIGQPLFERHRKGVALTELGKKILPQAKQVVEYHKEWISLGHESNLQGIELYINRGFSDLLLPHILIDFRQRHPDIPISFQSVRRPDFFISRNTDVPALVLFGSEASAMKACAQMQGNTPIVLLRGKYYCLISKNSPLAAKSEIQLDDLKELFLVLPGTKTERSYNTLSDPDVTKAILSALPPNHVITLDSLANVISQTAENPQTFATSFFPACLRYPQIKSGEVVIRPFAKYDNEISICLFYSREAYTRHPVMAELVDEIRKAFKDFSDHVTK